jgi:hypothetical protein
MVRHVVAIDIEWFSDHYFAALPGFLARDTAPEVNLRWRRRLAGDRAKKLSSFAL